MVIGFAVAALGAVAISFFLGFIFAVASDDIPESELSGEKLELLDKYFK